MKTINITISISEDLQPTIKSSIQEQINFHLKEKEDARKNKIILQNSIIELRDKILFELNQTVGAEAWFITKDYFNAISFRDGIYKNTSYNDWDIRITYETKRVVFGQIEYEVPLIEKGLRITLEQSYKNNQNLANQRKYVITNLDVVHEHLQKDYLTYFTSKL